MTKKDEIMTESGFLHLWAKAANRDAQANEYQRNGIGEVRDVLDGDPHQAREQQHADVVTFHAHQLAGAVACIGGPERCHQSKVHQNTCLNLASILQGMGDG
jgi:hypothetical protein